MINFTEKYARNIVYSQNGEEGILIECARRMGIVSGYAVEIGGHNGLYCSNIAYLLRSGWAGKFVEANYDLYLESKANWAHSLKVFHQCSRVDGRNVNAFVDERCDVLSLDTDGADYRIFEGLQARPRIVITEIDSSLDPTYSSFNKEGAANYFASLLLGLTKGYFLLCHTGNMIFVRNDLRELFPELEGDPLVDIDLYFKRDWVKAA